MSRSLKETNFHGTPMFPLQIYSHKEKIRTVSIPLLPTGMRNWNFSISRKELCAESFPEPLMK